MPAERLSMRKISRSSAPEVCLWGERSGDLPLGRDWPHGDRGVCPPRRGDRHHLADTGGARRHGAGAQAICAGRLQPAAIETASGVGTDRLGPTDEVRRTRPSSRANAQHTPGGFGSPSADLKNRDPGQPAPRPHPVEPSQVLVMRSKKGPNARTCSGAGTLTRHQTGALQCLLHGR